MSARFTISGFGDEIDADPTIQLRVLAELGIRHLDLRGAWGRNVLDFDQDDVARLRACLADAGARVSTIASPIGKSEIREPAAFEEGRLETAIRLADAFETRLIRVFSFYHAGLDHAACRDEVLARLTRLAERAARAGVTLLLENEGGLWGDRPERCREIFETVAAPSLRFTLDTGNFAALGVRSYDQAYPLLRPWLAHIQVKDVRTATGEVVLAGAGDGQLPELLAAAQRDGYQGFLALEPHLALAGRAGGFSGPERFAEAAHALQALLGRLPADGQNGLR